MGVYIMFSAFDHWEVPLILFVQCMSKQADMHLSYNLNYIIKKSLETYISKREVSYKNCIGRKQCHAINDQSEDRLKVKT